MPHTPETGSFTEVLTRVGEGLDEFNRYDRPDPMVRSAEWTDALTGSLPAEGLGADATIEALLRVVVPNGQRIADPRFFGFITAGPSTVPLAAATAAMLASPQRQTVSAFHLIEEQSLEWLAELCGLAPHMKGVYSSGGSVANLLALGAARQWVCDQVGIDAGADGLDGRTLTVYASVDAHHTVQRAAGVLGMGRRAVRSIPVDARRRIDVGELEAALAKDIAEDRLPVAVVATAGTTNCGAVDPLRACGELAREVGTWFHVDGAYGLPATLDPRAAPLFDGLELADSAIVDPHKWLGAPVGVAATFVRDRAQLLGAFTQEPADYLEGSFDGLEVECSFDSYGIPYSDMSVELSSPARGAMVWSILREQGRSGVAARVARDIDYAGTVHQLAEGHPRLESLLEPTLSIALIRYVGGVAASAEQLNELNRALHRRLIRETRYLPTTTLIDGLLAIRPCFINVRTTPDDVTGLVDEIVRIGDELVR